MNSYNIFSKNESGTILFHAIAESDEHVNELAKENNMNLTGLTINLEKNNVKNEIGKSLRPEIRESIIH